MRQLALSSLLVVGFLFLSSFTVHLENYSGNNDTQSLRWMGLDEAFEANQRQSRKIMVDVYTPWCVWCKKMDKTTFRHPAIIKYMTKKYYAVKLNAATKETIKVDGKEYKYKKKGRNGAHELASILLENQMNYPSTVFLDEKFNKLTIVPGYLDAPDLDKILRYFGDGFHARKIPWQHFDRNFKSRIK